MADTKIQWADKAWNVVTGCSPVSEGCEHCYAKRMATTRLRGRYGYPKDDPFRVTLHPDRLCDPKKWRKPQRVFVASMGDLFHRDVPFHLITEVFRVMALNPRHQFQILTKRPDLMGNYLFWLSHKHWRLSCLPNVWLGTSVESRRYNWRIRKLVECPAAVHWVSIEPMLEVADLAPWLRRLDWVVCGCETGPGRRPMDIGWVRDLRDQCVASGTPLFLKAIDVDGKVVKMPALDGKVWAEFPKVKK